MEQDQNFADTLISETHMKMDFSKTPTNSLLPNLFYNFIITELSTMEAGGNKTFCSSCGREKGKLMFTVKFKVLEPVEYAEAEMMEFFTVGVDADPCAHNGATLEIPRNLGAVNFGLLLDGTQTPRNQIGSIVGKRCQRATIQAEIEDKKNGGTRIVNNFARGARGSVGVYPVGTVAVGMATPDTAYPKGGSKAQPNGKVSNPTPASNVSCPRCKKEFSGNEIDDHVESCLNRA